MQKNTKRRIGVLRGGNSKHYNRSIKQGGEIIARIDEELGNKYKVFDILIDKDHIWHINGVPVNPSDLVNKIDLVWNVAHPSLSEILDTLSIPNIRIGSFFYALENNEKMLREHTKTMGLDMPKSLLLPVYQKDFDGPRDQYCIKKAKEIFEKFSSPWIVKSFTEDPSMGVHLAKTFPELVGAIEDGVKHGKSILVQEFISGKVASVHTVPGFRGEGMYCFPLGNAFGDFSWGEKEKLFSLAKDLHQHIGARHYLKSDFVLTPQGKVYLLQVESTPDLRENSHFSQACKIIGAGPHHVVEHILEAAVSF